MTLIVLRPSESAFARAFSPMAVVIRSTLVAGMTSALGSSGLAVSAVGESGDEEAAEPTPEEAAPQTLATLRAAWGGPLGERIQSRLLAASQRLQKA